MRYPTFSDPRVVRTKRKLRDALFQLLKNHLVEDITVTNLCRQANINRRTFYLHYDNVLQVFTEYEDDLAAQIHQTLSAPIHDVPALVATFNHIFEDNLTGLTYLSLNHRQQVLLLDLENMLNEALMNAVPNPTDQDRIVMRYTCNGIINVYVYWVNHQQAYTFEALTTTITQLITNSLAVLSSHGLS